MSGLSASAFSRRALPIKHHGQTMSETTSMRSGFWLDMTELPFDRKLCLTSFRRNHLAAVHAQHQGIQRVIGFQRRQGDIGGDRTVTEQRITQRGGGAACDYMSAVEVGLAERD